MPIPDEITHAIKNNNIVAINGLKVKDLEQYYHPQHGNIVLLACYTSTVEVLVKLSQKLGTVNFRKMLKGRDAGGLTALVLAILGESADNVNFLLEHKPPININEAIENEEQEDDAAIDYAIWSFNKLTFEMLVVKGAIVSEHSWNYIFNYDQVYIHEEYFTPSIFVEKTKGNDERLVDLFLDYFSKCHAKGINTALFFSYKDEHRCHALLACARAKRFPRFEKLLQLRFNLQDIDDAGHTLFYYLLQNSQDALIKKSMEQLSLKRFTPTVTTEMTAHLDKFNYTTNVSTKRIGTILTAPISGHGGQGRYPLAHPDEVTRPYRSFAGHRTRQLLRHIAAQLFFSIDKENSGLEEVQAMYLMYRNHHYLFLTGNPIQEFTAHCQQLILPGVFKKVLTTLYHYTTGHDAEKNARTARYACKLNNRIYEEPSIPNRAGDTQVDRVRAEKIADILRKGKVKLWNINELNEAKFDLLKAPEYQDAIILLQLPGLISAHLKLRHAEEFLVDVLDNLPKRGLEKFLPTYSCIAGKKRPCLGCTGRQEGTVTEFGQYPGRYWLHSMEYQSAVTAKRTAKILLERPAHVSITPDGMSIPEFDSGSDSEPEL